MHEKIVSILRHFPLKWMVQSTNEEFAYRFEQTLSSGTHSQGCCGISPSESLIQWYNLKKVKIFFLKKSISMHFRWIKWFSCLHASGTFHSRCVFETSLKAIGRKFASSISVEFFREKFLAVSKHKWQIWLNELKLISDTEPARADLLIIN